MSYFLVVIVVSINNYKHLKISTVLAYSNMHYPSEIDEQPSHNPVVLSNMGYFSLFGCCFSVLT